jgi:Tfp pilus assembly protein PilP
MAYKDPRPRKNLGQGVEGYTYDPAGKTDPFASFIVERERRLKELEEERKKKFQQVASREERLRQMKEARTELQKIDISQLQLTGILNTGKDVYAMVTDPKGIGHVLAEGTFIGTNGGVVDQIIRDQIQTEFGTTIVRKVIIKEPFLDAEGEIQYKTIEMEMAPFMVE